MKARRIPGLSELDRAAAEDAVLRAVVQPGDFDVTTGSNGQRWFWFCCPGPCASVNALALRPLQQGRAQPSWEWDGSLDSPTLSPSINHVGCWHGWLRAGEFTPC